MLGDVLTSAYPTWTVGVTVSYPLGASTQDTNLARARLQYDQAQTASKNLEMQIGVAGPRRSTSGADQREAC